MQPGSVMPAAVLLSTTLAVAQQWQWTLDRVMAGDFHGQCAYDEARERVVLFGITERGGSLFALRSYTFEWDGQQWMQRHAAPGLIRDAVLCWHPTRRRVVRIGGDNGTPLAGTAEWDGQTWSTLAPGLPTARTLHAASAHAANGSVVCFGGTGPTTWFTPLAETWELTGGVWTQRIPALAPAARVDHGMAFDPARQRTVLYGGRFNGIAGNFLHGDTWEWNGAAWTQIQPVASPPPRNAAGFAHDPVRARTVLFGGSNHTTLLADTWEYDGTSWQQVVTATQPTPRRHAAMVFDRAAGRMLLFGGRDDFASKTDTWSYDGANWSLLLGAPSPPQRATPVLAHDVQRQRTIVTGGYPDDGRVWEGDGIHWQSFQPSPAPSLRYGAHGAFDMWRGRTVLFGGRSSMLNVLLDETWEWDGAQWTSTTMPVCPQARMNGCMAFDVGRGVAVLFGGLHQGGAFDDTWEWDGTAWLLRPTATRPSAGNSHSMCFDLVLGRIVMFGGSALSGLLGETWHYDGVDWTRMAQTGPSAPAPRYQHAMAFHPPRGRTLLFGGVGLQGQYYGDLWEWNGSQWTQWNVPTGPEPQYGAAMTYDFTNDRLILTGGWLLQNPADTWLLTPTASATASTYGTGCGNGAAPTLRGDPPFLGNSGCSVELAGAVPLRPALLVGSLAPANSALPHGCTLLLQTPWVTALGATSAYGFARFPVPVPLAAGLRGATIHLQAAIHDGQAPLGGVSLTAGLRLTAGD